MFTGIVRYLGQVDSLKEVQNHLKIFVKCDELLSYALGGSIMVNGACLSLVSVDSGSLEFDVIKESINKTNLGDLRVGDYVNLEPSLTLSDKLDGHMVSGHVDFVSKLLKVEGNEYFFEVNSDYKKYIVMKGSVCLNGVSLTVSGVFEDSFKVSLIPLTIKDTDFQYLQVGDKVNVEIDIIARYLESLCTK